MLGGVRAARDSEKIWIWRYAKVPGKYTLRENLDISGTSSVLGNPRASQVVPMKFTSKVQERGTSVDIVEVRVVEYEYIRGRLSDESGGGWITMSRLTNKKKHEVKDYVVRALDGVDGITRSQTTVSARTQPKFSQVQPKFSQSIKRRLSDAIKVSGDPRAQPPQSFVDAGGYKVRPSTGGWKYGFKEVKNLGKITWSIDGLSQGCEDATSGDRVTVEMDGIANEKIPSVWSMYSKREFILQGCALLQGKRPTGLKLTMHIDNQVAWEGSVSIEPRDLCFQEADLKSRSEDLKSPEGQAFIPMRSSQALSKIDGSEWNLPVALWIFSYKCFSIQAAGFHLQRGDWKSWEVHLQIPDTTFHLLREEGCAILPFGC